MRIELVIDQEVRIRDQVTTTRAPEAVRNALLAKARAWRFQPVSLQGRPSRVRTSFHIVLAALPMEFSSGVP